MATQRRRAPARRAPQRRSGGGRATVSGSASASANVASGWLSGWFRDFSLIRIGGSGGGGGRSARRRLGSLMSHIQAAKTGSRPSLDGMDGPGCVECGGEDFHAPDCSQGDYTIDVEVISERRAIGPGGDYQ